MKVICPNPKCGQSILLESPSDWVGKPVLCPTCNQPFVVCAPPPATPGSSPQDSRNRELKRRYQQLCKDLYTRTETERVQILTNLSQLQSQEWVTFVAEAYDSWESSPEHLLPFTRSIIERHDKRYYFLVLKFFEKHEGYFYRDWSSGMSDEFLSMCGANDAYARFKQLQEEYNSLKQHKSQMLQELAGKTGIGDMIVGGGCLLCLIMIIGMFVIIGVDAYTFSQTGSHSQIRQYLEKSGILTPSTPNRSPRQ